MYRFEYNITEQDYFAFNEFCMLNSKTHKRTILLYRCLGFILSAFVILIFIITNTESDYIKLQAIALTIFSIVWFLIGKKSYFKKIRKTLNKLKKEDKLPYSEKGILIFDEVEISDISTDKELKAPYSTVTKLVNTDNFIYILCYGGIGYIVPLRIIDNNINIDEFKSFIESKTGLNFK